MPNPFPGMNPYLEEPRHWPNVHHRLITYICDALQGTLPKGYTAVIGERIYLEEIGREAIPDVTILERRRPPEEEREAAPAMGARAAVATKAEVALDEPLTFVEFEREHREPFVEIYGPDGKVVTVIEVLSPANKTAESVGRRLYLDKQAEIKRSDTNLVEIDLLGYGEHTVSLPEAWMREEAPPHRYRVCVSRAGRRRVYLLWPRRLEERLPRFGVPLKEGEKEIALDLQALLDLCYDRGGFDRIVNYAEDPDVPLTDKERRWLRRLLRQKGLRVKK